MPKYILQWKDPDFCEGKTGKFLEQLPEDDQDKLRSLGAQEYVAIEFDTDAMTAALWRRK